MNPLTQLANLGQGVWYNNLRRGLAVSGELRRMIDEYGVTGLSSSIKVLEWTISGTSEYDEDIVSFFRAGMSREHIVEELMERDAMLAAGVLEKLFVSSNGLKGHVSLDMLIGSYETASSIIKKVRHIDSQINRPNIIYKIPATPEGLKAIEELTYEGFSTEALFVFSAEAFAAASEAYLSGLERRIADGKPLTGIFSVAGLFVSRIDTLIDSLLEERAEKTKSNDERMRLRNLLGKVAASEAVLVYQRFREVFYSGRFNRLRAEGAEPMRALWASTAAKNPRYSDVKYPEALIQEGTIISMPLQTLLAFYDHGKPGAPVSERLDEAKNAAKELDALGVDYSEIEKKLFEQSLEEYYGLYKTLIKTVAKKAEDLTGKKGLEAVYTLNGFSAPVTAALEEMEDENILERLWIKDPTIWKTGPADRKLIKDALGWLTVPELMEAHKGQITAFAEEVKRAGFRYAVLLGMGGSSLAPLVLKDTFGTKSGFPELIVLDSTDPEALIVVENDIDLGRTLFIVSSKSGSTIEPLSLFEYFHKKITEIKGEDAGNSFIAITDPGTPLEGFSKKYGFRRLFLNPHDIGGRFSALSYFGLVPAAITGVDISKLLYNASRVSVSSHPSMHASESPPVMLGAALGVLQKMGRDKVTFFLSDEIKTFGLWIEQLIAESTGKEGKGIIPITGEPILKPREYADDRVFVHIGIGGPDKRTERLLKELNEAGHPTISFSLEDLYEIGGEFLRWEVATAIAGQVLGINPFDQPDVELSKKLTIARLNMIGKKGALHPPGVELNGKKFKVYFGKHVYEKITPNGEKDVRKAMKGFFRLINKGDYLGVLAYYNPIDKSLDKKFAEIRRLLIDATGAATQFGYGPRYLHSTGQLHKGGANRGVFIILCHEPRQDIEIPGSAFSLSELELSQAFGDMEALDSKGCRVALIELNEAGKKALDEAEALLKGAIGR